MVQVDPDTKAGRMQIARALPMVRPLVSYIRVHRNIIREIRVSKEIRELRHRRVRIRCHMRRPRERLEALYRVLGMCTSE